MSNQPSFTTTCPHAMHSPSRPPLRAGGIKDPTSTKVPATEDFGRFKSNRTSKNSEDMKIIGTPCE